MSKITYIGSDISRNPSAGYRDTILLYLDLDSGPKSPVLVRSLDELKSNFNSSSDNLSYKLAAKLLKVGYDLLIYRISTSYTSTSLRLFRKGGYSHPEKDRTYEDSTSSNIKYLDDISGTNLTYSSKITLRADSYSYGDYLTFNVGNYNILYWFNPGGVETKPTIPADEFVEGYEIVSEEYEDQISELKTHLSNSGFRVEDTEDGFILSRVNYYEFLNITTSDLVEKYDIGNFDILCEILNSSSMQDNKCCDF